MIAYADTSALIKRYIRETGSEEVAELFIQSELLGVVALAHAEMSAAISKAVRMQFVREDEAQAAWEAFVVHWPSFSRLPVTSRLIERASALAWKHGLRAYDSIHLAAAMALSEATQQQVIFACYDKRLLEAANREGLQIWPASHE